VYTDREVKRRCVVVLHDLLDTFSYSASVRAGLLSSVPSCIHDVTSAFNTLLSADAAMLADVASSKREGDAGAVQAPFVASSVCLHVLQQLLCHLPAGSPGAVAVRTTCDSLVHAAHGTLMRLAAGPAPSTRGDGLPAAVASTLGTAFAMHTLSLLVEQVGATLLHTDGAARDLILGILTLGFKKPAGAGECTRGEACCFCRSPSSPHPASLSSFPPSKNPFPPPQQVHTVTLVPFPLMCMCWPCGVLWFCAVQWSLPSPWPPMLGCSGPPQCSVPSCRSGLGTISMTLRT
jgi:hypothetical protein